MTGGGIIGGSIALGLYLLLSKSGAIIITILIILICLFFVFEDQIRQFFAWLTRERDPEEYEAYEEEDEEEDERYEAYERQLKERRSSRPSHSYEEPVLISEDEEGTIIRLVKTRKKHGRSHNTLLTRTTKKAQPLRDGSTDIVRSGNKARGVSNELDMMPHNANGDEIHEITRKSGAKRK